MAHITLQILLSGIMLGTLYAIIAIGLSAVFGIMGIINLAHGDLMIGASYISFVTLGLMGGNAFISLVIVVPVLALIGFALQHFLLNRVMNKKGAEPVLLTTFGLSVIIENGLLLVFSPNTQTLARSLALRGIPLGPSFSIPLIYVIDFFVGLAVIVGFAVFLKKTYLGLAIRAASDDETAATLQGVNCRLVYSYTMGVSMITAAIAGVLVGTTFTFFPYTGTDYLTLAFGVIVIGGLGNLAGTLAAGIILGLAQLTGSYLLGTGNQLLAAYLVLLIVLAIKPQGIFSRA